MFHRSFQHVSNMFPTCFQHVSNMFPTVFSANKPRTRTILWVKPTSRPWAKPFLWVSCKNPGDWTLCSSTNHSMMAFQCQIKSYKLATLHSRFLSYSTIPKKLFSIAREAISKSNEPRIWDTLHLSKVAAWEIPASHRIYEGQNHVEWVTVHSYT